MKRISLQLHQRYLGSIEEQEASAAGLRVTEVYPLFLFSVAGMLLFPVSTDLITLICGT